MTDTLRIKRRTTGSPGAPSGLANAELAYNEVDHTLYYGEGTGGAGGTATTVVPIGGQGIGGSIGSNANPIMDSAATPGVATLLSRGDHVHPSDTSRVAKAGDTMTGPLNLPAGSAAAPAITFGTPQTGFIGNGTAVVYASGGAATYFSISPTQSSFAVPVSFPSGSPTNPAINWGVNAGFYSTDSQHLSATTSGISRFTLGSSMVMTCPVTLPADPVNPLDAATKQYVDNVVQGISAKAPCLVATAGANITLSGTQTIDGVAVVAGNRVLVKDQTGAAQNGIWVVAAGVWARALDVDTWTELVSAYTFIEQGTINADNGYLCTVDPGGTLGTTNVTWSQFSGAGQIVAGAGLTKTGSSIDVVGTVNRIVANADNIDISSSYVGQSSIQTVGTITVGAWAAANIPVTNGGTGVGIMAAGYVRGNGTSPLTSVATIPNTDITGLGTMSTQNANAVAITGGTVDGIVLDCGVF